VAVAVQAVAQREVVVLEVAALEQQITQQVAQAQ
jgi:hypothetical protein